MSDLRKLVKAIQDQSPTSSVRLRQGLITAVAADGTCSVALSGSSTSVTGIKVASHVCPVPNASCWVATDGRDMFILNTVATPNAFVRASRSTNQSLTASTWTALTFPAKDHDTAAMFTVGTSAINITVAGIYAITATCIFTDSAVGYRHLRVLQNGTVITQTTASNAATNKVRLAAATHVHASLGDVITFEAYHSSNGALAVEEAAGTALWISPVSD